MYDATKLDCYRAFSQMSPEDDRKDAGEDIDIVGRWHTVGGGEGVCICETNNGTALTAWMSNWAGMCDIKVTPVVNDHTVRHVVKNNERLWPGSDA
jgi:hypothetical protein